MKFKINENFELDSGDITKLTIKLTKVTKNTNSSVAFFSSLNNIDTYLNRYYPELMTDELKKLISINSKINDIVNADNLKGKHNIKFYFDEFYFVEFSGDSYILYVHPVLNGAPGNTENKMTPNVDRQKVVCFPSSISSAFIHYYNQCLRNLDSENDEFVNDMNELIANISKKVNELVETINKSAA